MKKILFFLICIALTVNAKPKITAEEIAVKLGRNMRTVPIAERVGLTEKLAYESGLTTTQICCSLLAVTKDANKNPEKWDKKYENMHPENRYWELLTAFKYPPRIASFTGDV